jgi:hypothetical protein
MKTALAMIAVSMLGCANGYVRHGTATLALASLACDWGQTHAAARRSWRGQYEANPIMGTAPSPVTVDLYFAAAAVSMIAVAQVLPERWRPVLYSAVTVKQGQTIAGNLETSGTCGL